MALLASLNPYLGGVIVLGLLWLGFGLATGNWRIWTLAVGVDKRYSTSRFQAFSWTVVVLFSYTALFVARARAGSVVPFGSLPSNVLLALGAATTTTVVAAGITGSRARRDPTSKPAAAAASDQGLAALLEDDDHNPDLAKTQLLAWTFVALAAYLVATSDAVARTLAAPDPSSFPSFPDIDPALVILAGLSHGAYLGAKAVTAPRSAGPGDAGSAVTGLIARPGVPAGTAALRATTTLPVSVRVPGFQPSVNGLHFINAYPSEPDFTIPLPGIGNLAVGDASNGVCGGMVFTVRDVFETPGMSPIPATAPPAEGSPLFRYILDRLVASFDLPDLGFMKYYEWMLTPDGDTGWSPLLSRRGLAWKTIIEEWPARIRTELDAGRLCCLGLVTVASADPGQLGRNHQVLSYGYDLDTAGNLTLLIYDPNTPPDLADDVRIKLNLNSPTTATPISHNVNVSTGIRGFFAVDYHYQDPRPSLA